MNFQGHKLIIKNLELRGAKGASGGQLVRDGATCLSSEEHLLDVSTHHFSSESYF